MKNTDVPEKFFIIKYKWSLKIQEFNKNHFFFITDFLT